MMKLKAFTLVELMVVMAIIAFLSVGAYGGLTFALRQGRDTQRMRIADQIQTALTAYYADYAVYPGCGGWSATGLKFIGGGYTFSPVPAETSYKYCAGGLLKTGGLPSLTGKSGLADYFEGEYTAGQMFSDSDIRYYYDKTGNNSGNRFTVCVSLENPRAGMGSTKATETPHKGCYCNGSDQSDIACAGM